MSFINVSSGVTVIFISIILLLLYKGEILERLKNIGSLIQSFSFAIAIGYALTFLSNIGSVQEFGEKLHYSLALMFYGVIINILINVYSKMAKKGIKAL